MISTETGAEGAAQSLFSASVPYFTSAMAQGMGGYDIGAVVAILREMAGLKQP